VVLDYLVDSMRFHVIHVVAVDAYIHLRLELGMCGAVVDALADDPDPPAVADRIPVFLTCPDHQLSFALLGSRGWEGPRGPSFPTACGAGFQTVVTSRRRHRK